MRLGAAVRADQRLASTASARTTPRCAASTASRAPIARWSALRARDARRRHQLRRHARTTSTSWRACSPTRKSAGSARSSCCASSRRGAARRSTSSCAAPTRSTARFLPTMLELARTPSGARAARLLVHADGRAPPGRRRADAPARHLRLRRRRSSWSAPRPTGALTACSFAPPVDGRGRRASAPTGTRRTRSARSVAGARRRPSRAQLRLPRAVPRRLPGGQRARLGRSGAPDPECPRVIDWRAAHGVAARRVGFRCSRDPLSHAHRAVKGGGHYVAVPDDVAVKAKLEYRARVRGTLAGTPSAARS